MQLSTPRDRPGREHQAKVDPKVIKENVDEHTDNMRTVFKPPIEKWYMPFKQLSFEFKLQAKIEDKKKNCFEYSFLKCI